MDKQKLATCADLSHPSREGPRLGAWWSFGVEDWISSMTLCQHIICTWWGLQIIDKLVKRWVSCALAVKIQRRVAGFRFNDEKTCEKGNVPGTSTQPLKNHGRKHSGSALADMSPSTPKLLFNKIKTAFSDTCRVCKLVRRCCLRVS